MKLKQYVLLSIMLQLPITMHASDLRASLDAATSNLSNAQAALASLLGMLTTQANPTDTSSTSTDDNESTPTTSTDTSTSSNDNISSTPDSSTPSNDDTNNTTDTTPDDSTVAPSDNDSSSSTTPSTDNNPAPAPVINTPEAQPVNNNAVIAPVMTTMLTNNTNQTVYLVMLDQNLQQINPSNISLAVGAFSYIPNNAATIKIVDSKNQQLGATTAITQDNHYTITNVKNIWKISALPTPTTCNYTNATTIPLILTITVGDDVYSQQIAPKAIYTQAIDPSENVIINVHANISGIATSYNPALSYDLTIVQNELSLAPNSDKNKTLTNDTGWPMLVTAITSSNAKSEMILDDGEYYELANTTVSVMITPLITNQMNTAAPAKSCSITSKNGQLVLQF